MMWWKVWISLVLRILEGAEKVDLTSLQVFFPQYFHRFCVNIWDNLIKLMTICRFHLR